MSTFQTVSCHWILWLLETALEILFAALISFPALPLTRKVTFAAHVDGAVLVRNCVWYKSLCSELSCIFKSRGKLWLAFQPELWDESCVSVTQLKITFLGSGAEFIRNLVRKQGGFCQMSEMLSDWDQGVLIFNPGLLMRRVFWGRDKILTAVNHVTQCLSVILALRGFAEKFLKPVKKQSWKDQWLTTWLPVRNIWEKVWQFKTKENKKDTSKHLQLLLHWSIQPCNSHSDLLGLYIT